MEKHNISPESSMTLKYHPASVLGSMQEAAHFPARIDDLYTSHHEQIRETLPDQFSDVQKTAVIDALRLLSHRGHNMRMDYEGTMLKTQMGLSDNDRADYAAMANRFLEKSGGYDELVQWLLEKEQSAVSCLETKNRSLYPGQRPHSLEDTKGLAISLGAEIEGGLWPEHPYALTVDHLSNDNIVQPGDLLYTPMDNDETKINYSVQPIFSPIMPLLAIERTRAVGDILCGKIVLHIAKRATALVAVDAVKDPILARKSRAWLENKDWDKDVERMQQLTRLYRYIFDDARQTRDNSQGILPESSSYMLRHQIRSIQK